MAEDSRITLRQAGFVQRTYELAEEALRAGNLPFAALLVDGDRVLVESCSTARRERDMTRHAAVVLAAHAHRKFDPEVRQRSVLYVSAEPCQMCVGALVWAQIRRVIYGVSAVALGEVLGRPVHDLQWLRELSAAAGIEVRGPVMEDDGLRIYRDLWPRRGPVGVEGAVS